ncbi:phosphatase 2C-domain-containing protein [Talaromyces proteolyticus]|uniref:Protein phosphatase 2C homolog 2 n=1 Tax=Talaromyces proteolyticus TaxID=1131652 RepID=A0AAD4KNP3_9EURO|nr:phosphatase 2C-domain-containing protein [Talaromyces proteolyticus]KAH8697028.1 phosphatase 2C-domain-containing protein [Talaromyces proteolyticus]
MGQTLSEPVTEKTSAEGQDDCVLYGVSAMQGWRISMEDAHAAILDLQAKYVNKTEEPTTPDKRLSFFGVYDGHGGDKVALFAGENVHKIVAKQEAFLKDDIEQALKDGFLATDRAILEDPKYEEEVSGCTASVGIISRDKIWVANAGDSRSVLGVKGRAKPLSFDHKPQNEGEKARISAAGGFVDFGRVNGNLALSRAIGDFEFKKSADLSPEQQIVTAYPDVTTHEITEDDEFLVIACDGIWDCQSSQSVVEFVRRGIAAKQGLSRICENMMDNCLASNSETGGVGCDNMTMVIIGLLHGKTKEEWYNNIAERVAKGDGPVAPPEYAEFRGPGVRHQFDDSPDDYDLDSDSRRAFGLRAGRIILLGDGTEVHADQDEEDLFDPTEEEKNSENQVRNSTTTDSVDEARRGYREDTPGPQLTRKSPSE